jgi:hypothetical protein
MLSMPISPDLSMLWYDMGVYTIPNATGTIFIDVNSADDVDAFNELQFLAASKNIYFSRWEDASDITDDIKALSQKRADARYISRVFVPDLTGNDSEVYRAATSEEELTARRTLVGTGFRFPVPSRWPSQIRYRSKPRTFFNGSVMGHVRKEEWLWSREEPHSA